MVNNKGKFQDFLTALGWRESNNDYRAVNSLGFTGRYQFGEAILIDLGYYQPSQSSYYNGGGNGVDKCNWHGIWTAKAKQYGVSTYQEFKNNVGNIQEVAIQDELQYNLNKIIQEVGGARNLGNYLQNSPYTLSGILAAAHLQGAWGAAGLLTRGTDRRDEYGTKMTEYANDFSSYEVASDVKHPEFKGRGTSEHTEESYWYEYNNKAMDNILQLRLENAGVHGVKVLTPNYYWTDNEATAVELANDISINMHIQEKMLMPINLYGCHWVGMVINKNDSTLEIDYMDPEQAGIPDSLKERLGEALRQVYPDHAIKLTTATVEVQKYNNCGPEVIENFMKYLTGNRLKQEDVPHMHSSLLEDSLVQEEIIGLTGSSDGSFAMIV